MKSFGALLPKQKGNFLVVPSKIRPIRVLINIFCHHSFQLGGKDTDYSPNICGE